MEAVEDIYLKMTDQMILETVCDDESWEVNEDDESTRGIVEKLMLITFD